MRLNPKILWGLAWAGLALIVAVPSADILTSGFGKPGDKPVDRGSAAVLTSDVESVTTPAPATASPTPAKGTSLAPTLTPVTATEVTATRTANGVIITPAGGKLPAADATKPPATQEVAAIDPATTSATTAPKIVPRPMDSWLRPTGPVAPAATAPAPSVVTVPAPATTTAALPPPVAPAQDPVVIIEQPRQPSGPTPPSPIVDDTANWEEESLRDYLERRGILSGSDTRSSATVTQRQASPAYDPDGFYLSDGPGGRTPSAEERFWELFGDDPEGFTLF
jgi:hypothetical protein